MKKKIIKSFTIKGLFGLYDLHIPFESDTKILIGENGLGKTQVLNILYYTLTKQFERLNEFNFQSLEIELSNKKIIFLNKNDIDTIINVRQNHEIHNGIRIARRKVRYLADSTKIIFPVYPEDDEKEKNISKLLNDEIGKYRVLHLPTYRRIEEDLRNLGYNDENFHINDEDPRLIHFGMEDVEQRFNQLTQEIERKSKEGLSKISSEILSQLVNGLPKTNKKFLESVDENDIDIILARVGDGIKKKDQERIKDIVATKEIQDKDQSLLFFLDKLINVYDEQRELDNSIKTFRDICNKYLVNKKLIYDESKIEIYVRADGSDSPLDLKDLSSGEKQIISIFSRIYLSGSEEEFIVLFDEPELSLSIFWQKQLLPDIYNSGKCRFLFAVTHSPFIFENELDKHAVSLAEYLKPIKKIKTKQAV